MRTGSEIVDRLDALATGTALAVTLMFVSIVCALAFTLWASATLDFFAAFMHAVELTAVKSVAPMTPGRVLYGVAGLGVVGFISGLVFASVYNIISRER
jgi:2TM family of unknown function (DUF5676)